MIKNITNPDTTPVNTLDEVPSTWEGDTIEITSARGVIRKQYHIPVIETVAPTYRPLTKLEAMALVISVTGMDTAKELAFRKDPNMELFWLKWRDEIPDDINRKHPMVDVFLSQIVTAGHMTEVQKAALYAAWPEV